MRSTNYLFSSPFDALAIETIDWPAAGSQPSLGLAGQRLELHRDEANLATTSFVRRCGSSDPGLARR